MLGILHGIYGCQVASKRVPDQHHLVDPGSLPPAVQGCEEKVFRVFSLLGLEGRPA